MHVPKFKACDPVLGRKSTSKLCFELWSVGAVCGLSLLQPEDIQKIERARGRSTKEQRCNTEEWSKLSAS